MENLDQFAGKYHNIDTEFEDRYMTRSTIKLAKKYCLNKKVLTLGLGNGLLASEIEKVSKIQVVIEGSSQLISDFSGKLRNKDTVVHGYFEDINYVNEFDVILANHVLEHVEKPTEILKRNLKPALKVNGLLFITVPNANSLHRRIGVNLGLLKNRFELNSSDSAAGHQRVYDINALEQEVIDSGLEILQTGGYNLKLVSNAQMRTWSTELLDAIYEESLLMDGNMCANLFLTATKTV